MPLTVNLRKVGGSIMLAIPPALLEVLGLSAGSSVALAVEDGRLVMEPKGRRRYTLDELLAQCGPDTAISAEDREWLDGSSIGREII